MSVRASSSRITTLVVAGPILALVNQGATYAMNMWACGHHAGGLVHLVPFLTLLATATALGLSVGELRRARGVESAPAPSARFLATCAVVTAVFSAALIVAQWIAVGAIPVCLQS